jgi:hypothetical protein
MSYVKKIKNWYFFAKRSWIALGAGWISIPFSFTPLIGLDQAGALLICGVIVAEVLHVKRHRLFVDQVHPGVSTFYIYREVEKTDENYNLGIEITIHQVKSGKTTVNADNWELYQLANKSEFRNSEGTRDWDLNATMQRLEATVDYVIVVSAVVGTVLWAFAGTA